MVILFLLLSCYSVLWAGFYVLLSWIDNYVYVFKYLNISQWYFCFSQNFLSTYLDGLIFIISGSLVKVCFPLYFTTSLTPIHTSKWACLNSYDYFGQAISNLKANAAGLTQRNIAKPVADTSFSKAKPEHSLDSQSKAPEASQVVSKPQSSSVLPPGFFDDSNSGKTRSGKNLV